MMFMNTPFTSPVNNTSHRLDQMAWTIDHRGIDAIPAAALRELGFQANSAGANHVLTEVMLNCEAPVVARQRAFGRIAALLTRSTPSDLQRCEPCAA